MKRSSRMRRLTLVVAIASWLAFGLLVARPLLVRYRCGRLSAPDAAGRAEAALSLARIGQGDEAAQEALRQVYARHPEPDIALALMMVVDDDEERRGLAVDCVERMLEAVHVTTARGPVETSRSDPQHVVVRPGETLTFRTPFELPQCDRLAYGVELSYEVGEPAEVLVSGRLGFGEVDPSTFVHRGASTVSFGLNRPPRGEAPLWLSLRLVDPHTRSVRGEAIALAPQHAQRLRARIATLVVEGE